MDDNFAAAMQAMQLTPQEQFLYQYHLNNLAGPGAVWHGTEGISTIKQITTEINGKTYSIPTVWNGQIVSDDQAVQNAMQMGLDNFPSYPDEKSAQSRYDAMHDYMEKDFTAYKQNRQTVPPAASDALNGASPLDGAKGPR